MSQPFCSSSLKAAQGDLVTDVSARFSNRRKQLSKAIPCPGLKKAILLYKLVDKTQSSGLDQIWELLALVCLLGKNFQQSDNANTGEGLSPLAHRAPKRMNVSALLFIEL